MILVYTVNQFMKMKKYPGMKFACKKFQIECAEQWTWKRHERQSTYYIWRKYWKKVRCNLLITASSFILKCCCCVWRMGVATWFFLPPELSRLCDVHNPICSIKLYYQTGHCSVLGTKWLPLHYLSKSTVLHADLKHNKIAQWSGKL